MKIRSLVALLCSVVVMAATCMQVQARGEEKKMQVVKLTAGDSGYVVTPSRLVKGIPVRMEVDLQTVKGCARTVVISAFSVKKTVKQDDATIEFTPTKTGTIDIVCGMNMVKGTFTVVQP